jgi:alkylation response protein AidB-like acyl-CoA dehydrogenase
MSAAGEGLRGAALPALLPVVPPAGELRRVLELTHEVCREFVVPQRARLDETGEFPEEIVAALRERGLFRATFPEEYGGLGLHPLAPALICEAIGEYCIAIATIYGVTAVLAPQPLLLAGTEAQKQKYLPRLASGEWLASFAMTEPEAGSDITNMSTVAVKKGDRYVLNGVKKWITNASRADVYFVMAITDQTKDPRAGMSYFAVEKGTPGLSFGKLENKLGLRCVPNCPVIFEDVEVPEENLVGLKPNRGFPVAMRALGRSRTCVAAGSVGLARGAYREALKYTRGRKQFQKRLLEFQVVQHMLADMAVKTETARALTYEAARHALVDDDAEAAKFSAMAKYYASEIAMQVVTDALQLHGGNGFTKDYPVEKMFRDAKVLAIYEGTSQMLKSQIALALVQEASRLK